MDVNNETGVIRYSAKYSSKASLSVVLKDGFDFAGWRFNENTAVIPGSDIAIEYIYTIRNTENFALTARAEVKKIAIRYNKNDGSNETVVKFVDYGEQIVFEEPSFKNGDLKFLGWATERNGKIVYFAGDMIDASDDANFVLYAVWSTPKPSMWWIYILLVAAAITIITLIIVLIRRKVNKERHKILSKQ